MMFSGASIIPCIVCVATLSRVCCTAYYRPQQHTSAFAGFGGGANSKSKGKGKGKKKKKQNKVPDNNNLFTPEGRMEHIKARVASADLSPISKLTLMKTTDGQLSLDIDPNNIVVIDNFLGKDLITSMRAEAESLLPTLVPSQSTRWDETTQSVIA